MRSLDGAGPHRRGVILEPPAQPLEPVRRRDTPVVFTLTNTGSAAELAPTLHPDDASAYVRSDIYRLDASMDGEGWSARLLNALPAVEAGRSRPVEVYVTAAPGAARTATVTLRVRSESDPSRTATAVWEVRSAG
ncbi:MAG: hypothetical protein KY466_01780 [Gemmatimonadetes bacterium]|nr:hypothetical protein [Gemmatimonadota bacterium]